MNITLKLTSFLLTLCAIALLFNGCGKPADSISIGTKSVPSPNEKTTKREEGSHPVDPSNIKGSASAKADQRDPRFVDVESSLIPFSSSWNYPQVLNWRPATGLPTNCNPPRLSWPYVKSVKASDSKGIRINVFTLQISKSPDFTNPEIEIKDTPYNFYNALPILENTTWYWRVGYGEGVKDGWSDTKSFTFTADAVQWDRTIIKDAVSILSAKPRPRSGPEGGNWKAFNTKIQNDPLTQQWYSQMIKEADVYLKRPWWDNFPKTDVLEGKTTRKQRNSFINILKELTLIAYCHKLTGDDKYAHALEKIIVMAKWPKGGQLSPEGLGARHKMPSASAELFAVTYDWYYDELSPDDKATIKEAIDWRIREMYQGKGVSIWKRPNTLFFQSLSYFPGSHPYQNWAWSAPASIIMAGESEAADAAIEFSMHYLTGVTSPMGPDEGYNEGHGYVHEKSLTMLQVALLTETLFPELNIGKSPQLRELGKFFHYMYVPGVNRLPWGDKWGKPKKYQYGALPLRQMAALTGDGHLAQSMKQRERPGTPPAGKYAQGLYGRPWFEYLWVTKLASANDISGKVSPSNKVLKEAGWFFVNNKPIGDLQSNKSLIGLQMQARPRGGYSHSYASDLSFIWYAYGELLSADGGWRTITDPYAHHSMGHNSVLVNGQGQKWPTVAYSGVGLDKRFYSRPLAYKDTENYTYFAGDASNNFFDTAPGLKRWHRHVIFVDKTWFLIHDDLEMKESADPATFSWLFKVPTPGPFNLITSPNPGVSFQVGQVGAQVLFANNANDVEILHLKGREGRMNPISGEDYLTAAIEATKRNGSLPEKAWDDAAHHMWLTSKPSKSYQFTAALLALPAHEGSLGFRAINEKAVKVTYPDGTKRTVSFDPETDADIMIDIQKVREHAQKTAHLANP